eukprot:2669702-Rhodomonas_salina.2
MLLRMIGTDLGFAATRCPVPTKAMLLPGGSESSTKRAGGPEQAQESAVLGAEVSGGRTGGAERGDNVAI